MILNCSKYCEIVKKHYENVWNCIGTQFDFFNGPIDELPEDFKILEFAPHSNRPMWTYATCGMSCGLAGGPIELHMFYPEKSSEAVELLTAVSHYHRYGAKLSLGHTVNFGKPWIGTSHCEYGLISLPYLDGPVLENINVSSEQTAKCLWLIPIMNSELEFKKEKGLDELENLFDNSSFDYLNPNRDSVC